MALSEPTIVDNVLKHGTGAINVDGCRIPFKTKKDSEGYIGGAKRSNTGKEVCYGKYGSYDGKKVYAPNKGRFPANLIISDKAIDSGKITKSKSGIRRNKSGIGNIQKDKTTSLGKGDVYSFVNDIGDQSRYFDLDAWAEYHGFSEFLIINPKLIKEERNGLLKELKKLGISGKNVESI